MNNSNMTEERLRYLKLLAESFPSQEALYTEIVRLRAHLNLPKGTEHFMSDLHGEYEAFCHIMNNCSGVIREKVVQYLGQQLSHEDADALCTLIYYPEEVLKHLHAQGTLSRDWYRAQVEHMTYLARMLSTKYTRDRVRRSMPEHWAFILDELLHFQSEEPASLSEEDGNLLLYHDAIIDTMIALQGGDALIAAMASLIKKLAVDRLHVVGDIFDRGSGSDSIMDILIHHHSVDIEWGNHDILWMGAASGSDVCAAAVVRNCLAYNSTNVLERGYGIPLRELARYAEKLYPDLPPDQAALQAIQVIMFKLEGQLILRHPDWGMESHMLLHKINRKHNTVRIGSRDYSLKPINLQTVMPGDEYSLTAEEQNVVLDLITAFRQSPRLKHHVTFLYRRGWMYRAFNGNLIFHGCVPLNTDGSFHAMQLDGRTLSGKALMDECDRLARRAFFKGDGYALDFMWFLWGGADSPLCGRDLRTFARAYVEDHSAWAEAQNPYYTWIREEGKCREILSEFGLRGDDDRIVNGHTPVKVAQGESPLKAKGRLIVIDGGFCRAYQKTTGIAGYTLIANSHGMRLMAHQPFTSLKDAQNNGTDIHSRSQQFAAYPRRRYVRDTDHGSRLRERVNDLVELLEMCRKGYIVLQGQWLPK